MRKVFVLMLNYLCCSFLTVGKKTRLVREAWRKLNHFNRDYPADDVGEDEESIEEMPESSRTD